MKAAVLTQFGDAGELQIMNIKKPVAADNEVLIKVTAAGINPVDTKIRAGTSAMAKQIRLPAVLGWDVSGTVESAGRNAGVFKTGDPVFGCLSFPGLGKAYAEYTVAEPGLLAKKPADISFEEAAAVPLAGLTAYQAINEHLKISASQTVLIQAAAGGVGHLAVQFARLNGAFVSGTASAGNAAFLRSVGVEQVIDYKEQRFEEVVGDLDAVLDAMGGEVLYRSISCVRPGGAVVCLPSSTKNDPKAMALAEKRNVKLTWPMMYRNGDQLRLIADLLAQGKLKVHVDRTFPLEEIVQGHKAIESHHTRGKIVIKIA